jgi:antitoxin PrlF
MQLMYPSLAFLQQVVAKIALRRNVPESVNPPNSLTWQANPKSCAYLLVYSGGISESHTFREGVLMNDRKFVRMQEKGQVTIPTEIRKKLGLKRGDLVAVMETPDGVFITPQQVVAAKALDSIGDILKEKGLSLEEVISSGRELRTDILQETYGITEPPKENLSR